ncbi:B12-binding domain-containing radical SAM protein [Candidatus Solincola sp.]
MNVLFVHSEEDAYSPEKPLEIQERVQFGISYISSFLRAHGHRTSLVVLCRETPHLLEEYIQSFHPDLACFTAVYTEYLFLSRVAARIKRKYPDVFLLLGGPHASLNPDRCLEEASFDAVCVGEGEFPTLELVEQLEKGRFPSGIPNLYIRRPDGSIERNAPRPFLEDLDSLPFPDREMWTPWVANPSSRPSVLVGRGCPFSCTYCCNHALRKAAPGRYVRVRSPGNIVQELESMKQKDPSFAEVYLEVETLGAKREWALELCAELRKLNARLEVPIAFGANLRVTPNADYEELFAAFAESNFRFVNIGLESGSEKIRRQVLKRMYSNQDIIRAVETARKYGLQVGIYNLIGLPGETPREFRETVRVNRVCQPDWFLLSVFFPYPGTELYERCREQGLLERDPDPTLERRKPALDLPGFSRWQVGWRRTWFPFMVYRGHRPLSECLWLVAMAEIYSHRPLIRLHRAIANAGLRKRAKWHRGSPEVKFHPGLAEPGMEAASGYRESMPDEAGGFNIG